MQGAAAAPMRMAADGAVPGAGPQGKVAPSAQTNKRGAQAPASRSTVGSESPSAPDASPQEPGRSADFDPDKILESLPQPIPPISIPRAPSRRRQPRRVEPTANSPSDIGQQPTEASAGDPDTRKPLVGPVPDGVFESGTLQGDGSDGQTAIDLVAPVGTSTEALSASIGAVGLEGARLGTGDQLEVTVLRDSSSPLTVEIARDLEEQSSEAIDSADAAHLAGQDRRQYEVTVGDAFRARTRAAQAYHDDLPSTELSHALRASALADEAAKLGVSAAENRRKASLGATRASAARERAEAALDRWERQSPSPTDKARLSSDLALEPSRGRGPKVVSRSAAPAQESPFATSRVGPCCAACKSRGPCDKSRSTQLPPLHSEAHNDQLAQIPKSGLQPKLATPPDGLVRCGERVELRPRFSFYSCAIYLLGGAGTVARYFVEPPQALRPRSGSPPLRLRPTGSQARSSRAASSKLVTSADSAVSCSTGEILRRPRFSASPACADPGWQMESDEHFPVSPTQPEHSGGASLAEVQPPGPECYCDCPCWPRIWLSPVREWVPPEPPEPPKWRFPNLDLSSSPLDGPTRLFGPGPEPDPFPPFPDFAPRGSDTPGVLIVSDGVPGSPQGLHPAVPGPPLIPHSPDGDDPAASRTEEQLREDR